jgi:hypothetical protein
VVQDFFAVVNAKSIFRRCFRRLLDQRGRLMPALPIGAAPRGGGVAIEGRIAKALIGASFDNRGREDVDQGRGGDLRTERLNPI